MSTRALRLAPRDEDRATWCRRCDALAEAGVTPIKMVPSCKRCIPAKGEWLQHLGFCVLILGMFLGFLYLMGKSDPLVSPQESQYAAPEAE